MDKLTSLNKHNISCAERQSRVPDSCSDAKGLSTRVIRLAQGSEGQFHVLVGPTCAVVWSWSCAVYFLCRWSLR